MLMAGVQTVQKNFSHYLEDIARYSKTLIITRKNNENVVVISEKEYQALIKKSK